MPSYCLDINVGNNENDRDRLIKLLGSLKHDGKLSKDVKAQRGRYDSFKFLRVYITDAEVLQEMILAGCNEYNDLDPDGLIFTIRETSTDASRAMDYLPDHHHPRGYRDFEIPYR